MPLLRRGARLHDGDADADAGAAAVRAGRAPRRRLKASAGCSPRASSTATARRAGRSARWCATRRRRVPLETRRLPAVGRRQSHGPRLLPAAPHARALRGAAEGGQVLSDADYAALLGDLEMLARSGAVGYQDALPLAARQANSPNLRAAHRAFDVRRQHAAGSWSAPANAAKYAAWLRRHYGPRAHFLGWLPRKNESPELLRLRGTRGDAGRRSRGRTRRSRARRGGSRSAGLPTASAIPPESRRIVLVTAARTSGKDAPALFDALLAVAKADAEPERARRRVPRARLVPRSRAAAPRARPRPRTGHPRGRRHEGPLVGAVALRPRGRSRSAGSRRTFDALAARVPREQQAFIATFADGHLRRRGPRAVRRAVREARGGPGRGRAQVPAVAREDRRVPRAARGRRSPRSTRSWRRRSDARARATSRRRPC